MQEQSINFFIAFSSPEKKKKIYFLMCLLVPGRASDTSTSGPVACDTDW